MCEKCQKAGGKAYHFYYGKLDSYEVKSFGPYRRTTRHYSIIQQPMVVELCDPCVYIHLVIHYLLMAAGFVIFFIILPGMFGIYALVFPLLLVWMLRQRIFWWRESAGQALAMMLRRKELRLQGFDQLFTPRERAQLD